MAAEHMADSGSDALRPVRRQILDHFWEIAEYQDSRRLEAARGMIAELRKAQEEHAAVGKNAPAYSPEVSYAVTRLVRGLASGRKAARQGFSTVLAELLREVPDIPVEDVVTLIRENLAVSREEKGPMFGELFGYLSVVQSGRLADCPPQSLLSVFNLLQNLRKHKPYLQHIGVQAMAQVFQQVNEQTFNQHLWPLVRDELQAGWDACSPETLFLLLTVQESFPGTVDRAFLKKHWRHKDIFHKGNMESLGQVVLASATAHPNFHAVCRLILTRICEDTANFPAFWDRIVDTTLCSASHERKQLAFRFLEHAVPLLRADQISAAMSPSLLKMLINNLVYPDSFHSAAAKQLCHSLAGFVRSCSEPDRQLAVLMALLHKPGTIHFDSVTKTQTVASLVSGLNADAVLKYTTWLKKVFLTGTDSDEEIKEGSIESHRRWASNQLVHIVKHPALARTEQRLLDVAKFLFLHAFFKVKKTIAGDTVCGESPTFPLSVESSKLAAQHFNSVLSTLGTMPSFRADGAKHSHHHGNHSLPGTRANGDFWVYSLVQFANSLLLDQEHFEPLTQLSAEWRESWEDMLGNVEVMRRAAGKGCRVSESFQLLTLNLGVQMFSDAAQVGEILGELQTCYEKATEKKRKKAKGGAEEDEPHWVEVVVEILLSLLSRPSHLLRAVVDTVFRAVCPQLTRRALQLILDVLQPAGPEAEENHVTVEDSDEEKVWEEEDAKDRLTTNGDAGSEEESESEEEEEEGDDGEVDEEFKAKIKEALGKAAVPQTDDADDDDDDDSSTASEDSCLSDSAMMKLDESLSKIFSLQKKSTKATKKEAARLMTDFRQRVTDLLDIFVRRQPANPLVLDLVAPLLAIVQDALRRSEEQSFAEKVAGLYRNKLCKIKDFPAMEEPASAGLHAVLGNILQVAHMAPSVYLVSLTSAGCMFLLRVLRGKTSPPEPSPVKTRAKRVEEKKNIGQKDSDLETGLIDVQQVVQFYLSALENFMTRRDSHLHVVLFEDLVTNFPLLGWNLAEPLTAYITTGVQIYRRTQACHLLLRLINTHRKPAEPQSWAAFVSGLSEKVGEVLHGVSQGVIEVKPKFLQELLRTLQALIKAVEGNYQLLNTQLRDVLEHFSLQHVATRSSVITGLCRNCLNMMGHSTSLPTGRKAKKRKAPPDGQAPKSLSDGQAPKSTPDGQAPKTPSAGQAPKTSSGGQASKTMSDGQAPKEETPSKRRKKAKQMEGASCPSACCSASNNDEQEKSDTQKKQRHKRKHEK